MSKYHFRLLVLLLSKCTWNNDQIPLIFWEVLSNWIGVSKPQKMPISQRAQPVWVWWLHQPTILHTSSSSKSISELMAPYSLNRWTCTILKLSYSRSWQEWWRDDTQTSWMAKGNWFSCNLHKKIPFFPDEILNWYYHQFKQQQQQPGEDVSDDQLNQHYDQLDQQRLDALHFSLPTSQQSGEGPLFEFELKKSSLPQRWKNTASKQRFQVTFTQPCLPSKSYNVGKEIANTMAGYDLKKFDL